MLLVEEGFLMPLIIVGTSAVRITLPSIIQEHVEFDKKLAVLSIQEWLGVIPIYRQMHGDGNFYKQKQLANFNYKNLKCMH